MATISTSSPPSRRSRLGRWLKYLLLLLLFAFFAALGSIYFMARAALPQLDGTINVGGLSAPVTVIRDAHGVPTIDAANLNDLFFAQGYVTAQDRLWQMDILRRVAAGELAEVLGPELIDLDKEQRIISLRVAAQKALQAASPEARSHLEAYARGVNAFINSHTSSLPVEFRTLAYAPRPWTPLDSAVISVQMVKDLNHDPHQLAHEKILAKLGPELTADLYVNTSWHDRPPTVPRPTLREDDQQNGNDEDEDEDAEPDSSVTRNDSIPLDFAESLDPIALGSNDWVISGAHTVSGKPLLCDDMHLGHQMPNLWYQAHLRSGNFDVAGVTLPGMPYVIVGHNQRVAWGFTNVGPTVEDIYIENFNNAGDYQTPSGWQKPEHRPEVIHVKGKPDVSVDVVTTRHGPIVSDLIPGESRKLALRWTLYDGVRIPIFEIDSAQNWQQFRDAFSKFDAPGQNVVYADVDGNIGYQATGKVPIRATGDGSLPEDGSNDEHEWTSYIPFDKLPSVYNPPWGIIATANGRITPDGYPYSISSQWEAPWRTARIYRVLESGKKFSAADMLSLQTDTYSDFDRFVAEHLVYAVDHARHASARAKDAAEILRGWDGRMTASSPAPVIETRSRMELMRLLLEPKLGSAPKDPKQGEGQLSWKSYRWGMQSVWLENVLLHQPQRWLPQNYANFDELLTSAVESAMSNPDAPKNLLSEKWGNYNPVEIQHPILGKVPLLDHWTGPGTRPQSGSGYTVKAVSRHHGPSERMTVDLANMDHSTLNLVTGESGVFLSPYYMDQWKAWYEGFTFPWPFSKEAVERSKKHQLRLQP
jgi:penicillin amidase